MRKLIDERSLDDARACEVDEILRRQHGVIHREQLLVAGLTRGEVDAKVRHHHLHRILPSILATTPQPTTMGRIWAAMLWGGRNTVIAGLAALFVAGLTDRVPAVIDVYVQVRRGHKDPPGIKSRHTPLTRSNFTWRSGLRYTIPARTALDLSRWRYPDPVLPMLLRRGETDLEQIGYLLDGMTNRWGYARARRAVDHAINRPWSPPEQALHGGMRESGLTGWAANTPVLADADGAIKPDVFFDKIRLAIEVEGRKFHSEVADPEAFEKDARRRQRLLDAGWFVLRFTAKQIEQDLPGVVATIRAKVAQLATLYGLPAETFGL